MDGIDIRAEFALRMAFVLTLVRVKIVWRVCSQMRHLLPLDRLFYAIKALWSSVE
jgi:hypothetical protein